MAGNVWEWVEDWFHEDYEGAPTDGSGWLVPVGEDRVIRGGNFANKGTWLRSAARNPLGPGRRYANVGVRCVLDGP